MCCHELALLVTIRRLTEGIQAGPALAAGLIRAPARIMCRSMKRLLFRFLAQALDATERWRADRLRTAVGACGERTSIGMRTRITNPQTVFLGHDVSIGEGAWLSAENASIHIGNYVMFGPEVALICGNHNIQEVGIPMFCVKNKRPGDDLPITIEDDVWLGYGTTVLKGVTVGRGSVVAAGAVVTRDVPRYAVVAGVPARVVRMRWSEAEIAEHERVLYGKAD